MVSLQELLNLIHTLHFWCVVETPFEIYDYVIKNKINIDLAYLEESFPNYDLIREIKTIVSSSNETVLVDSTVKMVGCLNLLKYLHENGYPWSIYTYWRLASNGELDALKYAYENECPLDKFTSFYAAYQGHLECLKYAHKIMGCPWDINTCIYVEKNGHLDCLQYAIDNGCPCN